MWKNQEPDPSRRARSEDSPGLPRQKQGKAPPEGRAEPNVDLEELLGIKDGGGASMSILDVWYLIKERWLIGLIVGLVLGGIAAALIMNQPKQYESFVQFNLKNDDQAVGPIFENRGDAELDAHVTKVTSQNFYDYLADGLGAKPELQAALGGPEKVAIVNRLSQTVRAMRSNSFVKVSVRAESPTVASDLANEIATSYRMFDEREKVAELKKSEESLSAELESARTALSGVHQKIIELGKRTDRIDGGTDIQSTQLLQLKNSIPPMEAEVQAKEQKLTTIRSESSIDKKLAMNEFASASAVQEASSLMREAQAKVEVFEGDGAGPNHPDLIDLKRNLSQARTQLENAVRNVTFQLENELDIQRKQLEKTRADVASLENQIGGRTEYSAEWAELETKKEQFQNRIKENQRNLDKIRLSVDAGLSKIEALDRALPNYGPVTPDKRLALVASLAIFSFCLVGLPVTLGLLDTRLKSISEIERFLGVDVLATVPAKKASEIEDLGLAVMMANDEAIVESFRVLYSSLRMVSTNDSPHTMLVTSSAPSEGKSFISTNLAAFFAEQGKRTLIIDCDFRKPTQHRNVKESNDQGVIRWFHSDEPVPQDPDQFGESKALGFLALGDSENLFLLRAGGTSKSPTAMIESTRFAQLIHSLRAYFDVILFDTPPVGLFPDALFVADYTDESIFVTKFRELNRHKVKFALSQLQKAGCNVLGIVVNHLTTRATTGYGYGYSDYGYGHYSSKDYARYYATDDSDDSK